MLTLLRVLALHVGLQEGIAHEGFVTEVALGRRRVKKSTWVTERGFPVFLAWQSFAAIKAEGETSREAAIVLEVHRCQECLLAEA